MLRAISILSAAVVAASLATATVPATAEELDRQDVEAIVKDYLLKHPEVVRAALQELERREAEKATARQREMLSERREELNAAGTTLVAGNPDGDVTLVEFFDYNCSFCKRAHADLEALIEADDNVRVVFKEWPFLSAESLAAAKVSLAVAKQGRYIDFHTALLTGKGMVDENRALQVAEAMGYDMDKVRADMDDPEILSQLEKNMILADAIGVTGTPAYVAGDQLILGAQGLAALQAAVEKARDGS